MSTTRLRVDSIINQCHRSRKGIKHSVDRNSRIHSNGSQRQNIPHEIRRRPKRRRAANLPEHIASLGTIDQNDAGGSRSGDGGAYLKDEDGVGIVLTIEGEDTGQACRGGEVVDAGACVSVAGGWQAALIAREHAPASGIVPFRFLNPIRKVVISITAQKIGRKITAMLLLPQVVTPLMAGSTPLGIMVIRMRKIDCDTSQCKPVQAMARGMEYR